MSDRAPDLETAERELRAGPRGVPGKGAARAGTDRRPVRVRGQHRGDHPEWAPGPQVTTGYTVSFPDGHSLVLASIEKTQR